MLVFILTDCWLNFKEMAYISYFLIPILVSSFLLKLNSIGKNIGKLKKK